MGGEITYEVKFCCKGCVKKFLKNPKKYVDNIEKVRAEQDKKGKPETVKEKEGSAHKELDGHHNHKH